MSSKTHEDAAQAYEHAHSIIVAARAARERSEQIRTEKCLRRRRVRPEPAALDPDTEAALRARLVGPAPLQPSRWADVADRIPALPVDEGAPGPMLNNEGLATVLRGAARDLPPSVWAVTKP